MLVQVEACALSDFIMFHPFRIYLHNRGVDVDLSVIS